MITLQPSQQVDLEKIRAANYVALLAVEMGYGKTYLAIAAAIDSGAKQILVIAPQSTHSKAWDKSVKAFDIPEGVRVVGKKNKAQKQALEDLTWGTPGWYVMTPQFFTRSADEMWSPDMLIVDEAHMLTEPGKAGQVKLSGYSRKDRNPLSLRAKYKLALTGTPARNKFYRLWSLARFLWPELDGRGEVAQMPFSDWKEWRMHHEYNPFSYTKKSYTTEIYPGQFMTDAPCVVMHKRREKCCEFHPEGFMPVDEPTLQQEYVELTPKQIKQVADLEKQALAWMDNNPLVAKLPITKRIRIRQAVLAEASVETYTDKDDKVKQHLYYEDNAASPFAERIEEVLEELGDEPVVVFTSSQIYASYLAKRLTRNGFPAAEISGATRETRDKDIAGFGTKYRVIVAVIAAVGTGTDGLQSVSATEIWVDRSDDRTDNEQARARLDRFGQSRQVHRIELFDSTGYSVKQWDKQAEDQAILDTSLTLV